MTAKSRMITRSYVRFISFHSVIERETCANSLKNQMQSETNSYLH